MISSSQRIVTISASVLAALALIQLVLVFTVLIRRPTALSSPFVGKTSAAIPPEPSAVDGSGQKPLAARSSARPLSSKPLASAPTAASESAQPLANSGTTPETSSELDILLKRALAARDKGDMSGTLAGLRDAEKLFPDNPRIIAEFATTYEQMGLIDKSLAQWKRVMDAGEKAGDLYGVAAEKVKMGLIPREPAGGRDAEGLQTGSTFGFVDLQKNYEVTKDNVEKVSLRVGIKMRQNATVNPSKLNIQVMFYDLLNNTDVEPTDAKVTSEWLTAPVDWQDDGIEVLRVLYSPKVPAGTEKAAPADKKYLGYVLRVYYENELQDVYADPVKLLQYFPPQLTLQKEIPQ